MFDVLDLLDRSARSGRSLLDGGGSGGLLELLQHGRNGLEHDLTDGFDLALDEFVERSELLPEGMSGNRGEVQGDGFFSGQGVFFAAQS